MSIEQLGRTLLHEGRHVEQGLGHLGRCLAGAGERLPGANDPGRFGRG